MKILRAWVDDPTERGEVKPPLLCIETDAYPDETHDATFRNGWTQQKYGPFVWFDYEPNADIDAGDYNVAFAGTYPAIIDISLFVEGKSYTGIFGIPIPRARQLVRKHSPEWRIVLSDRDAIDGAMLWVPQQVHPRCRHWRTSGRCCGVPAVNSVRKQDVDFPLCGKHLEDHNHQRAEARRASASK